MTAKPRDTRILVLWVVALTVLIASAFVLLTIVAPVLAVRRAIADVPLKYQVNDEGCAMAVDALGGREAAAKKLSVYINMPNWAASAKSTAVFFLAATGEAGTPAMLRCLDHASDSVRGAAVMALIRGHPAGRQAVPKLMALSRGGNDKMSWGAILALGAVGPEAGEAVPLLIEHLRDRDPQRRQFAAKALGQIGDQRAMEPLRAATADQDESVRSTAEKALARLQVP
ncbi:MAG TPA: HEAT repeat domain-containing protein [Phycisphaerae bacterium]|nr:HEAT repeat domain-containing protein [Phycisphaerae bacterium]